MSRLSFTGLGPSPDSTLYTLIASVEPNYLRFINYMEGKGVLVQKDRIGSKADYTSLGIDLKVGYLPSGEIKTPRQAGEAIMELGTLVILTSTQNQDIVEEEAEKLLKSIREVEDPTSVQILANMSGIASDRL